MLLDFKNQLHLKNPAYLKAVKQYVWQTYLNDLGKRGDMTTQVFLKNSKEMVTAEVIMKQKGVLAGMLEAKWLLSRLGLELVDERFEGEVILKGEVIMRIQGPANKILGVERTLLNLLQRMSGIATKTQELTAKLPPSIKLLATRKTLWGELDKRAATVGGAATHRLNLADAILVKENHFALSEDPKKSLKWVIKKHQKVHFIDVEVESPEEAFELIDYLDEIKVKPEIRKKMVFMLDNFTPTKVKKALPQLKRAGVTIEVSGGISESNIKKYAVPGIHAISSGSITMSAPAVDISLQIL